MSGALTHPPSKVVRQALVDLGIGTLPIAAGDWPVAVSQEADKARGSSNPDAVLTVFDTAGVPSGRTMIDGVVQEHYGFQVRIKNADFQTGYTKASEIQNAIDSTVRNTSVTVGSSVYTVYSITRTGSIISVGKEPTSKRSIFTINAVVAIRQTT